MIVLLEHIEDHLYIVVLAELPDGADGNFRRFILRKSEYAR